MIPFIQIFRNSTVEKQIGEEQEVGEGAGCKEEHKNL